MKKLSALLLSVSLISGCATILKGQTQPITILTPGAEDSICTLSNEDMRYEVEAGEKIEIMKSNHDLIIDCRAPGNRQRTVIAESQLEPTTILNASNGAVPGVTYDHFSRGLYAFPEVVTVDFSSVPAKPYDLPDYMRPELRNVQNGEVERYGASTTYIPSDAYDVQPMIRRKQAGDSLTGSPFNGNSASSAGTPAGSAPTRLVPVTEK